MVNFRDLGISLKEGRPFILGDGKFSGFPKMDILKCWRHLENRDAQISRRSEKSEDSENLETHNFGTLNFEILGNVPVPAFSIYLYTVQVF